jgi:hypothetical protein
MSNADQGRQLSTLTGKSYVGLYDNMRSAIIACHAADECKDIADKSAAMATYFKQIKDDDSVRKFKEIRLRAFRRIGEIIASGLDFSRCCSHADKLRLVKSSTQYRIPDGISDARLTQCIRLALLNCDNFENAVEKTGGSIDLMLIFGDPDIMARRAREDEAWRAGSEERERQAAEADKRDAADKLNSELANILLDDLIQAHSEASKEVGLSLVRRDRVRMKEIVFIVKRPVYETLRKAAFDQRTTMQDVLRRGLAMWFAGHGYAVPLDEIDPNDPN